jgi:hypothetical protein
VLKKNVILLGFWLMVVPFAVLGCDDENYSCAETVDTMYGSGCRLWCECDFSGCDPYSCEWHNDNDPTYFTPSDAESMCEEMKRMADKKDCHGKLNDLLRCFIDKREDDCGESCGDAAKDFWHCASKFLYFSKKP